MAATCARRSCTAASRTSSSSTASSIAYDAKTGEKKVQERLAGGTAAFTASPVAADGKVYLANEDGQVFVLKAGPTYETLALNDMAYISIPSWVLVNPNPVKDVLFLIRSGIKLVPLIPLASQTRWMKVNNYKNHTVSKRVKDGTVTRVDLGDEQLIPIRVSYCSASQFMHRTLKQRDAGIKYQDTLKEKTGFRLEFDYLVEVNGVHMMDVHNVVRDLAWKIQRGEMPPSLNGIKWCDQPKHPGTLVRLWGKMTAWTLIRLRV